MNQIKLMKMNNELANKKWAYDKPQVEVIEMEVEDSILLNGSGKGNLESESNFSSAGEYSQF